MRPSPKQKVTPPPGRISKAECTSPTRPRTHPHFWKQATLSCCRAPKSPIPSSNMNCANPKHAQTRAHDRSIRCPEKLIKQLKGASRAGRQGCGAIIPRPHFPSPRPSKHHQPRSHQSEEVPWKKSNVRPAPSPRYQFSSPSQPTCMHAKSCSSNSEVGRKKEDHMICTFRTWPPAHEMANNCYVHSHKPQSTLKIDCV